MSTRPQGLSAPRLREVGGYPAPQEIHTPHYLTCSAVGNSPMVQRKTGEAVVRRTLISWRTAITISSAASSATLVALASTPAIAQTPLGVSAALPPGRLTVRP